MKTAPFKLKSGNKPSIAKLLGVSPLKQGFKLDKNKYLTKKEKIKQGLITKDKNIYPTGFETKIPRINKLKKLKV